MKKWMLAFLIFMAGCTISSPITESVSPLWSNLKLIFEYGGMPAVIMLFGYLYLRRVQRDNAEQMATMQVQFARQQEVMVRVMINNTEALNRLATAMMMGCPLIRSQLDIGAKSGEDKPKG